MKKIIAISICVASLFAALSCQKETSESQKATGLKNITFTAAFDCNKTELTGAHKVYWVSKDEISVFSGDINYKFTTQGSGASAEFSGEITPSESYYAVYPYDKDFEISGATVTCTLPASQNAVSASFAAKSNLAVAKSQGSTLLFKNVGGLFQLTISRSDIKSVAIKGNNDETVAGLVDVSFNDNLSWASAGEASKTVTLTTEGEALAAGTYYIVALPQTFSKGVSIILTNTAGATDSKVTFDSITLSRADGLNLKTVDTGLDFNEPALDAQWVGFCGSTGSSEVKKVNANTSNVKASTSYSWIHPSVTGKVISIYTDANTGKDVRRGSVKLTLTKGANVKEINLPVVQAGPNAVVEYDSFAGETLDNSKFKGDYVGLSMLGSKAEEGTGLSNCLKLEGKSGEPTFPGGGEMGHVLFLDSFIKWKDVVSGNFNPVIFSVDFLANQSHVGVIAYNKQGYNGSYDFSTYQNYNIYMAAQEGSTSGAFYFCFNIGGASAMDNPITPSANCSKWMRFKFSNVNIYDYKDGDELRPSGTDWTFVTLVTLKEENGVLVDDKMVWQKCMWTWSDNPQVFGQEGHDGGGYFGIYVHENGAFPSGYFRNFTISHGITGY